MKDLEHVVTTDDYDKVIISEVRGYKRMLRTLGFSPQGHRVLDLGAHKGFFTRLALDNGAKKVVSVEPRKASLRMLKINGKGATILHGACETSDRKTADLTDSPRTDHDTSGSIARSHSSRVVVETVKVYQFAPLVRKHRITMVKMDIQGSEWSIFTGDIPPSVKIMFGELHCSGTFPLAGDGEISAALKNKWATNNILRGLRMRGFHTKFRRERDWHSTPAYGTTNWFQDFIFYRGVE